MTTEIPPAAVRWGDILFTSGLGPGDQQDLEGQIRDVMAQLGEILDAAGSGFQHVIKIVCWLEGHSPGSANTEVWMRLFAEYFPKSPPARMTMPMDWSTMAGVLVEIEAIAGIPG
jgi:2-iminobutanoate/2-iminopropanoate deaminase